MKNEALAVASKVHTPLTYLVRVNERRIPILVEQTSSNLTWEQAEAEIKKFEAEYDEDQIELRAYQDGSFRTAIYYANKIPSMNLSKAQYYQLKYGKY